MKESDSNTKPCAIYSSQKISVESDSVLENICLASEDVIDMGSKITLGNASYCNTGNGVVFLAARPC